MARPQPMLRSNANSQKHEETDMRETTQIEIKHTAQGCKVTTVVTRNHYTGEIVRTEIILSAE